MNQVHFPVQRYFRNQFFFCKSSSKIKCIWFLNLNLFAEYCWVTPSISFLWISSTVQQVTSSHAAHLKTNHPFSNLKLTQLLQKSFCLLPTYLPQQESSNKHHYFPTISFKNYSHLPLIQQLTWLCWEFLIISIVVLLLWPILNSQYVKTVVKIVHCTETCKCWINVCEYLAAQGEVSWSVYTDLTMSCSWAE